MGKYIAIIDHTAQIENGFTYIKLNNTEKALAFAEGTKKGFSFNNVFCVNIAKQISKNRYQNLIRVYQLGSTVEDLKKTNNGGWGIENSYNNIEEYQFTTFDNKMIITL